MCGFAGYVNYDGMPADQASQLAQSMAVSMRRRGPDAQTFWTAENGNVGLAHARLSVIDLSEAGSQPMHSSCGRFVIAYNGEVYNSTALRQQLSDFPINWRGHSDTEVILEACAHFGVEKTVTQLIGMFAFALWDKRSQECWLVRDRLGIKPLYWGQKGNLVLFGSELKALKACKSWGFETNRDALSSYLRFNYVPAPYSIFKDVQKCRPGHILHIRAGQKVNETCYWDAQKHALEGIASPWPGDYATATDHLEALLTDAVGRRMVADVPLGAFLSGGIDSSLVVALMQKQSDRPVRSFSIGMDVERYNEAQHARAIANHLGTDHTELYITPEDARSVIPDLADFYDEPFADSSQIPTYLVSRMAREHVTVSLSGDGGDELFTGYNRYFWGDLLNRRRNHLPPLLRKTAAEFLRKLDTSMLDKIGDTLPKGAKATGLGSKVAKVIEILDLKDEMALFRRLVSVWHTPDQLVHGGHEPHNQLWNTELEDTMPTLIERMQFLDITTYLVDDILTKVDRASMAASLEARVPLLDHRVVEFAFTLPREMRVHNGQGKRILRDILARHVPRHMFERPKQGFGIPIGQWLSGPLAEWVEDLLSKAKLAEDGLIDPAPVRAAWEQHKSGQANNEVQLWTVLMYQAWKDKWVHG